jgi:hypothetical protein
VLPCPEFAIPGRRSDTALSNRKAGDYSPCADFLASADPEKTKGIGGPAMTVIRISSDGVGTGEISVITILEMEREHTPKDGRASGAAHPDARFRP